MNELWDASQHDVTVATAPVNFPAYEHYKQQAQQIAEYINGIVLTEDNVKDVKKELAAARKITDGLDRKRIDIRKVILSDYTKFEEQVKEIQKIIKDAEDELRVKVREMDEEERAAKKEEIHAIWCKRYPMYSLSQYLEEDAVFEKWLTPQHLNKTASIKSVEKDMVEWLEKTDKDLKSIELMDKEYLIEYLNCLDLSEAIAATNIRMGIRSEIDKDEEDEGDEATAAFIITGEKDIKFTEMLLKENDIEFIKR